jgi:hypothetical protein
MSEKLEQRCKQFKEKIRAAEVGLDKISHHVESVAEHGVDSLGIQLKEAEAKYEASREHAAAASLRITQFLEEKKDDAVAKFEDWKTDRDIEKIEKQADKKEQQALDAITVAAFAILEAEVSLVDALRARKMAIEVAG